MVYLFKVWDSKREKKVFVSIMEDGTEDMYVAVILKASQKLDIDGVKLVLESDGTVIDEGEVLNLLSKETFMLLQKDEIWYPQGAFASPSLSTCSTETFKSNNSEEKEGDGYSANASTSSDDDGERRHNISESSWDQLKIPFDRLRKQTLSDCEKGIRTKEAINEVVHLTVDAIREIKQYPPCKIFKKFANQLVIRFPSMFKDIDDDNVVIGDGSHSMYNKLLDRNNYLNRPHKRKSMVNVSSSSPKQRKVMSSRKAGCQNWQPETHTLNAPETLDEKKSYLFNRGVENDFSFDEEILKVLEETYTMQRLFINNPEAPTINDILEQWPVLLKRDVIFWHFNKLMNQNIHDLETTFILKAPKIIKFGVFKKYLETVPENDEEKVEKCFIVLGKFFNEDNSVIFITSNQDEGTDITTKIRIYAPCIVITGLECSKRFSIYVEKRKVEETDNFMTALKLLFSVYYNLNISYPKENSLTLEFVQRYIMKIHPDQGSKSAKKSGASKLKIISLINQMNKVNDE